MSRFVDLYCFFENRKTRQEAKVVLDIAFGKSAPTVKCVRSWYKRFRDTKVDLKDAERSGRPMSAVINEKDDAVPEMVTLDSNATYKNIQAKVSVGSAAVNTILQEKLKCKKLVAR